MLEKPDNMEPGTQMTEFKSSRKTRTISVASEGYDLHELTDEDERLFTAIAFGKMHKVTSLLPALRHPEVRDPGARTPLLHAAHSARPDQLTYVIKLLLQAGSDVNAQDAHGVTSLMYVIRRGGQGGPVDAVRALMRCSAVNPDLQDAQGNTALMYAAKSGSLEALALLLFFPLAPRHACVGLRNAEGDSALDVAVSAGEALSVQMLVEEGGADTGQVRDGQAFRSLYNPKHAT